jgi:2-phosphosulfolactate phosphatase
MQRQVVIDVGPPVTRRFGADEAVAVVDVIRATTTAVTVAALGGRCLPVPSLKAAHARASALQRPLLVGEIDGKCPDDFDLQNSPAKIARRSDLGERPVLLLSSSGTPLLEAVKGAGAVFPVCLRNWRATARHLTARYRRVTVMGAASRGQLREEDQLCCAYIAGWLADAGFAIADDETRDLVTRWSAASPEAFLDSESVRYLQRTGQLDDLDFILRHVDDLQAVFRLHAGEIKPLHA